MVSFQTKSPKGNFKKTKGGKGSAIHGHERVLISAIEELETATQPQPKTEKSSLFALGDRKTAI